jgi:hypothetical protein
MLSGMHFSCGYSSVENDVTVNEMTEEMMGDTLMIIKRIRVKPEKKQVCKD